MSEGLELYEALARMRDHHYAMGDILDKLVQSKAKLATKDYDAEKIHWIERTGTKGPYQFADPKTEGTKSDFKALLADLKEHNGKFRHGGMFYWVFNDAASIGRKELKKPDKNDSHTRMSQSLANIHSAGEKLTQKQ